MCQRRNVCDSERVRNLIRAESPVILHEWNRLLLDPKLFYPIVGPAYKNNGKYIGRLQFESGVGKSKKI